MREAGSRRTTCRYLAEARPDSLFATPRLWEKLQGGILAMVEGQPDEDAKAALKQALEASLEGVRAEEHGEEVTDEMRAAMDRAAEMFRNTVAVGADARRMV